MQTHNCIIPKRNLPWAIHRVKWRHSDLW